MSTFDEEFDGVLGETQRTRKKLFKWFLVFIAISILLGFIGKACGLLEKNVVDTAFINYEQFQEIWNTCEKINTDLGIMKGLPETDVMFEQFSKAQRVSTLKMQLNKWVEDYNAKSKMWNRSLWKSSSLPYQLKVENYSNY